jgi:dolichyl-phosphate-mannose--protein O-mannosyl transferase
MVLSVHQQTNKQKTIRIVAKSVGLVFAILFSLMLLVLAAFPMGNYNTTKDYIEIAILCIYPIGLFLGLKWQGLGGLISLAGFIYIVIRSVIQYFPMKSASNNEIIFFVVLFLIQMIPVTLYLLSWYYHRNTETKYRIGN